jgi:hypothetical protein
MVDYTGRAKIARVVHAVDDLKTAVSAYCVENRGTPASADVNAIRRNFGVAIATQYATFQVDSTGVITATIQNANADTDGRTITRTPDKTLNTWAWVEPYLLRTCRIGSYCSSTSKKGGLITQEGSFDLRNRFLNETDLSQKDQRD